MISIIRLLVELSLANFVPICRLRIIDLLNLSLSYLAAPNILTILWPDIQEAVATSQDAPRSVRSTISIEKTTPWAFGITLIEAQKGESVFRLWRFYPGPPPPGGFE